MRIENSGYSDESDSVFHIISHPPAVDPVSPCDGVVEFNWPPVNGIDHYEIYRLVNDEMILADTSLDEQFGMGGLDVNEVQWFAVSSVSLNGITGRRNNARSVIANGGNLCPWENDAAAISIVSPVAGRQFTSTALGSTENIEVVVANYGTDSISGFDINFRINGGPIISEIFGDTIFPGDRDTFSFTMPVDLSSAEEYAITVWTSLAGDSHPANDTVSVSIGHLANTAITLPYWQGFESVSDTVLTSGTPGIPGAHETDYYIISGPGRLRTLTGNSMVISGSRSVTLDSYEYGSLGVNSLILTLNMSGYVTTEHDIRMSFKYMHHQLIPESDTASKVWIRGNDTAPWICMMDLYDPFLPAGAVRNVTSALQISDSLMLHGQEFSSSFQIRFGQQGAASADAADREKGITIDDISLFIPARDLRMLSVDHPSIVSTGLQTENIRVTFENTSKFDLDADVSYSVNNGPVVTESVAIGAKAIAEYTFVAGYDFSSYGEYAIRAWIHNPGDTYNANDTLNDVNIVHYPVVADFPYCEDFEGGNAGWFAGGVNRSLELDKPAGSVIRGAAGGDYAWVTNARGEYNNDEYSYLISPAFDVSELTFPILSFAFTYDLEENYDYSWVEYSTNGAAWTKLGAFGDGTNWYNNSSENAWDGLQEYWRVASMEIPVNDSMVQFRFIFRSDVGLTLEGIGLDLICIHDRASIYDTDDLLNFSKAVAGNNWVHFDSASGRVASIHPLGQDLGEVTISTFLNNMTPADDGNTYFANRNWVIGAENPPSSAVSISLYLTDSETRQANNATGCQNCVVPKSAFELQGWKFDGIIEDSLLNNNTMGTSQVISADSISIMPYDNGYQLVFTVNDFSEFWITGPRVAPADSLVLHLLSASDDAEEFVSSGGVDPFSDTLDLAPQYLTGARFQGAYIPAGAFIRDARIILTSSATSGASGYLRLQGIPEDNTDSFATGNYDISVRSKTGAFTDWAPGSWSLNGVYISPSVRSSIQEIVDRPGWTPGNAIAVTIGSTGNRQTYSFDSDASKSARLVVVYDTVCLEGGKLLVDKNATGNNTGETWADAIVNLQDALDLAARCIGITEIWVSAGTYTPSISDRNGSFEIPGHIAVYGGFSGTETMLSQRNPAINTTHLSGDVGIMSDSLDNSYHVITAA